MELKSIEIFDTHAHLDLELFENDLDETIRRLESGHFPEDFTPKELEGKNIIMSGVLLPGIDLNSSCHCIALAEKSPLLYPAVGIHPNSVEQLTNANWKEIERLAQRSDVVGIGETGLDLYWDRTPLELQIDYFQRHIELSQKTDKPILIHCRDAWDEMLPILRRETVNGSFKAVIHAFSGTSEQASECVDLGFSISFAGSLTYRNAKFSPLWEAAQVVPSDRLLIETDSPYMTPHPFRGKLQRNEPSMSVLVAVRLAELRGESVETIAETTKKNARKLFNITDVHTINRL